MSLFCLSRPQIPQSLWLQVTCLQFHIVSACVIKSCHGKHSRPKNVVVITFKNLQWRVTGRENTSILFWDAGNEPGNMQIGVHRRLKKCNYSNVHKDICTALVELMAE